MAVLVERAMMEVRDENENIHPFFGKRTKTQDNSSIADSIMLAAPIPTNKSSVGSKRRGSVGPGQRRARNLSPAYPGDVPQKANRTSGGAYKEQVAELFDLDPNLGRRKRQKSMSPGNNEVNNGLLDYPKGNIPGAGGEAIVQPETDVAATGTVDGYEIERVETKRLTHSRASTALSSLATPTVSGEYFNMQDPLAVIGNRQSDTELSVEPNPLLNESTEVIADSTSINASEPGVKKPQKTLRLNLKTGTIGSPPNKLSGRSGIGSGTKRRPERASAPSQSLVVTIKYGHDNEVRTSIGQAIDCFLSGVKPSSLQKPNHELPKSRPQTRLYKPTHPFFLGKITPKASVPDTVGKLSTEIAVVGKATGLKSTMTLGEAKIHSPAGRGMQATGNTASQHLGNATKITKYPGAVEPCWPPRGMVHIRGLAEHTHHPHVFGKHISSTQRKFKYTTTETLIKDDILKVIAKNFNIDDILESLKVADTNDFPDPERSLRVPKKYFENGLQIQRRVRRELSVKSPSITECGNQSSSEDELQCDDKKNARVNPALINIYRSLPSSLTAFDRSQYETQSWIHKYSPSTAAEVLQSGREAFILKAWLQALTVIAVDIGSNDGTHGRTVSMAARRSGVANAEKSGKKKRKSNKLEGFVISSDEEEDEMDEISDPEEGCSTQGNHRMPQRTVIRSSDTFSQDSRDSRKLKNAIVISGPSGCGKTAMVYGVAKELGYEIFEINSSTRRSGKEILERVGDMTRNHLVHRSEQSGRSDFRNEGPQRMSDILGPDLNSGPRGTVNAFFKPKQSTNATEENPNSRASRRKDHNSEAPQTLKSPPKQQKQSLILLEEVDVLFEEDRQFWATVMNLIAQSKRPIIMTCNDETLLPLQALELHAILRLSPPPTDAAVDYMLLVAAAEGHIVKRNAVKALYEARQFDLRAALTELDYWCQLGVGDRKGGLDWFYPRWPPGCDVDEYGHTIRVVSEGTYKTGMGWLGRDFIFERSDQSAVKEEVLREAWEDWNIDLSDWHEYLDTTSVIEDTHGGSTIDALLYHETFAQSISMADAYSRSSLATGNQILLDPSDSPISAKARDDFVVGYQLLQADTRTSYHNLDMEISIWIRSQARELLQSDSQSRLNAPSEAEISAKIASLGRRLDDSISRQDFSVAFDPIAEPEKITPHTTSSMEHSVFDRTTSIIAVDVAPYVRSIIAYDTKLQQERARLSNLLSEGGRKGKRPRTTRSALSALEGSARKITRPERYFRVPLNPHLVNRTGLQSWQDAVAAEMTETEARVKQPVSDVFEGSSPGLTDDT